LILALTLRWMKSEAKQGGSVLDFFLVDVEAMRKQFWSQAPCCWECRPIKDQHLLHVALHNAPI